MWAERLVTAVCEAAGIDEPEVNWRRSSSAKSSSGRYNYAERRLTITAGKDRRDQRLVLLHELAHHLTPKANHGPAFWRAAWALYQRFGLARYALTRELSYKAAAVDVAIELGVRGARAAAKTATEKRRYRTAQPRNVCPMPADQAEAQGYRTPHTHYVGTVHRHNEPDGTFIDYWTPSR
jgi:hypothetical protein